MTVTSTELKSNLGYYLEAAEQEEVYITRNGKLAAKLTGAEQDKPALLKSITGLIKGNTLSLDEARAQRLARQ